jgi:hypothetical protein
MYPGRKKVGRFGLQPFFSSGDVGLGHVRIRFCGKESKTTK